MKQQPSFPYKFAVDEGLQQTFSKHNSNSESESFTSHSFHEILLNNKPNERLV